MADAISFSESELSKRVRLADVVPLEKPFTVNLAVSNVCNLKCEYCTYTNPEVRKYKASLNQKGIMDFEMFKHAVDDIKKSFGRIKQVVLVGAGEPLLNPNIADMVGYVKKNNITDRIDILTNGVALTEELSDKLIANGLTYLRVSLNGLSDSDFKKFTGKDICFDEYVSRLSYFYKHKGNTKVYIKILNYMVDTDQRKEMFYHIFSPICDVINIENLHKIGGDIVDYEKIVDISVLEKSKYYDINFETQICAMPYYYIYLDIDGNCYPCCESESIKNYKPLGNIKNESIGTIWKESFINFQKEMLNGMRKMNYCEKCTSAYAFMRPDDILDNDVDAIKERYDKLLMKG